jgi:hypothetical protein
LIMADTSFQRHPGLTALAGVLIGGVVTAASTWIIGPEVDRENRNASRRELATLTILESIVVDMVPIRRELGISVNGAAAEDLELIHRLQQIGSEVWIQGIRSGVIELQVEIAELRRAIDAVDAAWSYLPRVPGGPDREIKIMLRGSLPTEQREAREALQLLSSTLKSLRAYLTRSLKIEIADSNPKIHKRKAIAVEERRANEFSGRINDRLLSDSKFTTSLGGFVWQVLMGNLEQDDPKQMLNYLEIVRDFLLRQVPEYGLDDRTRMTYWVFKTELEKLSAVATTADENIARQIDDCFSEAWREFNNVDY